jgi:hypothetical protein
MPDVLTRTRRHEAATKSGPPGEKTGPLARACIDIYENATTAVPNGALLKEKPQTTRIPAHRENAPVLRGQQPALHEQLQLRRSKGSEQPLPPIARDAERFLQLDLTWLPQIRLDALHTLYQQAHDHAGWGNARLRSDSETWRNT